MACWILWIKEIWVELFSTTIFGVERFRKTFLCRIIDVSNNFDLLIRSLAKFIVYFLFHITNLRDLCSAYTFCIIMGDINAKLLKSNSDARFIKILTSKTISSDSQSWSHTSYSWIIYSQKLDWFYISLNIRFHRFSCRPPPDLVYYRFLGRKKPEIRNQRPKKPLID